MKIQTKLYAIVAVLGLVAIAIAVMGIRFMQGYNTHVDEFAVASERVYYGEHLNRLITAVVMESRGVYAAPDTTKAKPFADGIVKGLKDIDALMATWSPKVPADRRAEFDAVVAKAKDFMAFRTETARLGTEVSPQAANTQGNNDENRANRKQLQADVDVLVGLDKKNLDEVRVSIDAYYQTGFDWLIGLAVAGLIVGTAVASWIGVATITRPLLRVAGALGHLTAGNLSVSLPDKVGSDEVGRLWQVVGTFRDTLVEGARLKERQAALEAEQAVQRQTMMNEVALQFETEVGELIRNVTQTAGKTLAAAEAMVRDAEETAHRSTSVAATSEQTSANVQAVAGASEELSSSIAEIGRQISEAAGLIGATVEQTRRTDQDVRLLSDSAAKVGSIVAMIQAIAEQTNLLALNATIEAARAGDAGRGFAVVASEVKALASQTGKATQDIEAQMSTIQTSTQQSVEKIADISRRIADLDEITSTIASAAVQQNAATGEIARNISEAAVGASSVASTIVEVRATAERSGHASRDLLGAMERLASSAQQLETKVGAFVGRIRAA